VLDLRCFWPKFKPTFRLPGKYSSRTANSLRPRFRAHSMKRI